MDQRMSREPSERQEQFENASREDQPGLLREFCQFLKQNKKWWLVPFLIVLLLFGILIVLSGTGAAPFIYTFH